MNKMYEYLLDHNYISENKTSNYQSELSIERAECIANKYDSLTKVLKKENKILRENAENNDKVVDKVNWDNRLLKQALSDVRKYIDDINKEEGLSQYIDTSRKLNTISKIIDKVLGDDSNENK